MPHVLGTSPSIRLTVKLEMVGLTETGTVRVSVQVFVPILVEPLYVSHVIVQVPLVVLGI